MTVGVESRAVAVRAEARSQTSASCNARTKTNARSNTRAVVARLMANARSARNVLARSEATSGTNASVLTGSQARATLKTASATASGGRAHSPLSNDTSPLLIVRVQRRSRCIAVVAGSGVAAQNAAGAA
jgi:hypothetical protein